MHPEHLRQPHTRRPPLPPPPQRPGKEPVRSPLRLSLAEREEISRGLAAGQSMRQIARGLKRSPSTVCREIAANGGPQRYRACDADKRVVRKLRRPKPVKLRARRLLEGEMRV